MALDKTVATPAEAVADVPDGASLACLLYTSDAADE